MPECGGLCLYFGQIRLAIEIRINSDDGHVVTRAACGSGIDGAEEMTGADVRLHGELLDAMSTVARQQRGEWNAEHHPVRDDDEARDRSGVRKGRLQEFGIECA